MRLCYGLLFVAALAVVLYPLGAFAYPNYNGSPSCDDCHPGFVGGFSGPLHGQHLGVISGCNLCHGNPGDNPKLEDCAGCHVQAGLVAHHDNAGAPADTNGLRCINCHPGLTPDPESAIPPYYVLASSLVKDPCNSGAAPGEDFTGDGQGLDNDGDLVYDELDTDCGVPVEDSTWGAIKALFTE